MLGLLLRSIVARFALWRARRLLGKATRATARATWWTKLEARARGPAPLRLFDWARREG